MTKLKYDLKNDPKFKNKVAKLEGNQHTKVLKTPLRVTIRDNDYFVVCIGINGAYMVVMPIFSGSGPPRDSDDFSGFQVFWTKSDNFNKVDEYHDLIGMAVLNWSMMHADESSFTKKKHLDVRIVEMAIEACSKIVSQETMSHAGPTFPHCIVQNTHRYDILNPYHRG